VFATDIFLSFFTAYYDQEVLITDHKLIARHYLKCGLTCACVPSYSMILRVACLLNGITSAKGDIDSQAMRLYHPLDAGSGSGWTSLPCFLLTT
jgi:hypothetical protein